MVAQWLQNGMADTLGPLPPALAALPAQAPVVNPRSGTSYRVHAEGEQLWLSEQHGNAAPRRLPLHWRIGAGIHAVSLVARAGERWWFAPLEFFQGHGYVPAPHEQRPQPLGLRRPITPECLSCHTTAPPPFPYPHNALGGAQPSGLDCAACHGDPAAHLAKMRNAAPHDGGSAILNPADLPPQRQLDVCARCHLQGDARIELAPDGAAAWRPGEDLFARRAVFVAAAHDDDFGFVSQVERLSLSACFRQSPAMTCTTCHDPHLPMRLQTTAEKNAACLECHPASHAAQPERTDCAGCHMRRSQPFDLGHVAVQDHWIRRQPPPPEHDRPIRELETRDGRLSLFRYRASDAPRFSGRELQALEGMALAHLGQFGAAAERLAGLPEPATPAALQPAAGEGPWPLLRLPMLHFQRGRVLESAGLLEAAAAAYADALTLDPELVEAKVNQANVWRQLGRIQEALAVAEELSAAFPQAETPWNLRANLAAAAGRLSEAASALQESLARQPDQAGAWRTLSQILSRLGRNGEAAAAIVQAERYGG